jgi:hypothetical protein
MKRVKNLMKRELKGRLGRYNMGAELGVERHASSALRYLEEGKGLVDKDPVQASEKLYKAAEETVKALAIRFGLGEVLKRVSERGRWTVTELEKAVSRISESLGEWFDAAWDAANYLHVWGFHEAKLDVEDVKKRLPRIERAVLEALKIV